MLQRRLTREEIAEIVRLRELGLRFTEISERTGIPEATVRYRLSHARSRPVREPTAEEVERLVAEQSRPENLPAWWWSSDPERD